MTYMRGVRMCPVSLSCPLTPIQLPPSIWAFGSMPSSLKTKVTPSNLPVGLTHVLLWQKRRRNKCGTKNFVLNPFPCSYFGDEQWSFRTSRSLELLFHRRNQSIMENLKSQVFPQTKFFLILCSPENGKHACPITLTRLFLKYVVVYFLEQTWSFSREGTMIFATPHFDSVWTSTKGLHEWTGSSKHRFPEKTFKLGLENAQELGWPRGRNTVIADGRHRWSGQWQV